MLIVSIILETAVAVIAVLAAMQGRPYLYGLVFTFAAYVLYDLARLLQWPVEGTLLSGLFLLATLTALFAVWPCTGKAESVSSRSALRHPRFRFARRFDGEAARGCRRCTWAISRAAQIPVTNRRKPPGPEKPMTNGPSLSLAELEQRIAIARDNIRQLIEQAAAQSGAEDEDRNADRIAQQQEELDRLIKQRDRLLKK